MPRFAANLSMLYTEFPVVERFERAAAAGFQAAEYLFPYADDIVALRAVLDRTGMKHILFNLPAGNFAAGDRGFANDPRRQEEFREGVKRALEIAATLDVRKINCLVGKYLSDVPEPDQWATVRENLAYAAEQAAAAGVLQLVEPLNPYDAPGFLLVSPSQGFRLVDDVGHPNLKLEYDVYHAQRTEGNLTATIRERIAQIGHVQVADSPARNQPGTGEINYSFVFATLDDLGYDGWIGLEYKPLGSSDESITWLTEMGYWP